MVMAVGSDVEFFSHCATRARDDRFVARHSSSTAYNNHCEYIMPTRYESTSILSWYYVVSI